MSRKGCHRLLINFYCARTPLPRSCPAYGGFNLISLNVFDDCHAAPDPDNGTTVTADAQQASNSEAATTSTHAVHVTNVAPPAERVETGRAFVRPLEGSGGRCVGGFSNEVAGRDGPGGGVWPKVQWLADRLGEALDDISALDDEVRQPTTHPPAFCVWLADAGAGLKLLASLRCWSRQLLASFRCWQTPHVPSLTPHLHHPTHTHTLAG